MEDFKCVTDTLFPIMRELRAIQNELDSSLAEAKNVLEETRDNELWNGEAALVGRAFLDLVVKYHSQLAGETGESPVEQAYTGLDEYVQANSLFYDEWSEYQMIKGI